MANTTYIPRSPAAERFKQQWDALVAIARDNAETLFADGTLRPDAVRHGRYDVDLQFVPPCVYVFLIPGAATVSEQQRTSARLATCSVFVGIPPQANSDQAVIAGVDVCEQLLDLYTRAKLVFATADTPIEIDTVTPTFTALSLEFLIRY